jgi:hypothetical protein
MFLRRVLAFRERIGYGLGCEFVPEAGLIKQLASEYIPPSRNPSNVALGHQRQNEAIGCILNDGQKCKTEIPAYSCNTLFLRRDTL